MERFPIPLGAWDGLRYFIVTLPEPSINYFTSLPFYVLTFDEIEKKKMKKIQYELMRLEELVLALAYVVVRFQSQNKRI